MEKLLNKISVVYVQERCWKNFMMLTNLFYLEEIHSDSLYWKLNQMQIIKRKSELSKEMYVWLEKLIKKAEEKINMWCRILSRKQQKCS